MSIPTQEQETVICIGRDDKKARVYTSDTRWMTKMDKVAARQQIHKQGRAITAVEYVVPEKYVKVAAPRKRVMSAEQKAKLAEQLKKARKEKSCCPF